MLFVLILFIFKLSQAIDVVPEPYACRMAPVVVDVDIQDILNIPKERHQLALGLEVNICQGTFPHPGELVCSSLELR